MLLQKKGNIKVSNDIHIIKRNIKTKQVTEFLMHNICTDKFNGCCVCEKYGGGLNAGKYLEIGTGTTEPSSSDETLTQVLGNPIRETSRAGSLDMNNRTCTVTYLFTVPASSAYVGDITELGIWQLYSYYGGSPGKDKLMTHSLFKDAEGNPITIHKTDLDELIITYNIHVTFPSAQELANYVSNNSIVGSLSDYSSYDSGIRYYQAYYDIRFIRAAYDSNYVYKFTRWDYHAIILANISVSYYSPVATVNTTRIGVSSNANGHFINSLSLDYRVDLPIIGTMAQATISDYTVGVGDGATQDFTPPIPAWLLNTEKIYINGVLQTRGVDYTIDNVHNIQHNCELTPSLHHIVIGGLISSTAPTTHHITRIYTGASDAFKLPTLGTNKDAQSNYKAIPVDGSGAKNIYMTNQEPFIIKVPNKQELFGMPIDTIYISTSFHTSEVDSTTYDEVTLEASNDGNTWQIILEDVTGCPADKSTRVNPKDKPLADWAKYALETPVDAIYWRISIKMEGYYSSSNYHNGFGLILTHEGSPLHFTSAPAQNAVITMDCDIDRPWKDDQHVVDIGATWEW